MKKAKRFFQKQERRLASTAAVIAGLLLTPMRAVANGVQSSQIVTGTENLLRDVTTWLMILAPIAAALFIIYFCIRRSAADEMDQKQWNNRIIVAVVSCIGAVLGSATLNLILGYYR